MIKIAINGFGRIGRAAFKAAQEMPNLQVVAINDLTDAATLAHLLAYDTAYGQYLYPIKVGKNHLQVADKKSLVLAEKDPAKLPWKKLSVDVVLECTGIFLTEEKAASHLQAGAKGVILSAPSKDENIKTYVLGVNEKEMGQDKIISNASCTTNCIAPVMKVLQDEFGLKKSLMSTIHSYTADQNLVDGPHRDWRRARAAAQNIVPTTTGAAKTAAKILPALKNKFDGLSVRVPTAVVSLSDITCVLNRKSSKEEINAAFKKASKQKNYQDILAITDEPLVSSDFIGNSYSAVVDLSLTQVIDGDLVKIIAWYDNEWAYSCRLVEMVEVFRKRIK